MELLNKIWQKGKDFLGVKYPIISGGMTWISNYELCKAIADNGAFPVLAGGNMPPVLFKEELQKCVGNIKTPFAANLITIAPNYKAHLEIVKDMDVPFVVFAGSFPNKDEVELIKNSGKKTFAFASTDSIAKRMINYGIDALILEGSEAGGHIGHVSLTILLQQVLFKYQGFPIFVAGGIANGQIMAHLLLMGAYGVQLGTRFVMSEECTAHPDFKKAFKRAKARQAIATPQYDSKLPVVAVRALKNKAMDNFGKLQLELLKRLEAGELTRENAQYEVENYWVGSLRNAVVDGDTDTGSLMAGQSVGLVSKIQPIKEILEEMSIEAETELQRVKKVMEVGL